MALLIRRHEKRPRLERKGLGRRANGDSLQAMSLVGIVVLSGRYLWPRLRQLRLRSPLHTPSPSPAKKPTRRPALSEAARRRELRTLLISLAQAGGSANHGPPHIQQRWIGAASVLLEGALGHEVVEVVLGLPGFRQKLAALRALIDDLDSQQLRPDFDPRDHQNMSTKGPRVAWWRGRRSGDPG